MSRVVTASVQRDDVVASVGPAGRRRQRRRLRRAAGVAALGVAAAATAGVVVGSSADDGPAATERPAASLASADLPAAPSPALEVPRAAELNRTQRGTAVWAPVLRPTL